MPKNKSKTLADFVADGLVTAVRQNWLDILPAEAREEITAVRERYKGGGYGQAKRGTIARLIHANCVERGWKTCDTKRLSEWLRSDR